MVELLDTTEIDEDRGQAQYLYSVAYKEYAAQVEQGYWKDFFPVACNRWERYWTGESLDSYSASIGLHLWWGAICRDKARRFCSLANADELRKAAPRSVLAAYAHRHPGNLHI